jgi:nitroreductase
MEYDSFLGLVQKRRSIRQFKPDPVPDEFIDKIIEVARWAPSGFHTQPWEFVVVKNKEIKDKIADILTGPGPTSPENKNKEPAAPVVRDGFRNAPVFIILLGDWRTKVGLPAAAQASNESVAELFCSGLASAFLYMHLAVASLGLASQWCTAAGKGKQHDQIREIIGVPDSLKIYDMMALGYAAYPPVAKELRARHDMVHYDDCGRGDFRTDDEVLADVEKYRSWCIKAH